MTNAAHAYNVYEAETHLSQLLNEAEAGNEVVISRNGRSYTLSLVVPERRVREGGFYKGRFWMSDDFDEFTEQDEKDWYDVEKFRDPT